MTALVLGALLALVSFVVVAAPYLRRRKVAIEIADPIEELRDKRRAIYNDILILQNDYNVGQVPQDEYARRVQEYRVQAALLLKEEEQLTALDQHLEAEILAERETTDTEEYAEAPIVCPDCNRVLRPDDSECPACGAVVAESVRST